MFLYISRMVFSKINSQKKYDESKTIDHEDKGYAASVYERTYFDKEVVVVLGKPKYTFASANIVFYPIYIVSNDNSIQGQIGVYEIAQEKALKVLDEEGDIDIDRLGEPLFYAFAEKLVNTYSSSVSEYLSEWDKKAAEKVDVEDVIELSDEDENEEQTITKLNVSTKPKSATVEKAEKILERGVFTIDANKPSMETFPEETETVADEIKKAYKESSHDKWIEKFMQNKNYDIQDVESNGDCFFAVIRDAFKQIGHHTTVEKLRAIVANAATDEIFKTKRELYIELESKIKECKTEKDKIKKILEQDMKKRAQNSSQNKTEFNSVLSEIARLKEQFKEWTSECNETQQLKTLYLGDMDNIDTLEKFREFIMKPRYWADSWAVSILEKALKIKMVIFSELAYKDNALQSVLNCGEIDPAIQAQNTFKPDYYIMTSYTGNHYTLVTYRKKAIFTFHEIPYHVKIMIVNKCIEKNSGIYYLIQDFRNFKSGLGIDPDMGKSDTEEIAKYEDLYDPAIVFMFHSKSYNGPKPGKGTNEKIPVSKIAEYVSLGKIPEWRRKLDDSWSKWFDNGSISIDKLQWASVEHFYQASKFKKGFPDFYQQFSVESGSEISKDVDMAKAAGSLKGVYKKKRIRPANIVIDPDFYGQKRNLEIREYAVRAKFSQITEMKSMLLFTKNAKLNQYIIGDEPEPDEILMKIRKELHP